MVSLAIKSAFTTVGVIMVLGVVFGSLLNITNTHKLAVNSSTTVDAAYASTTPATTVNGTVQESNASRKSPITHVIVIFQENRAFDNYFGTYPGADGIQNSTCMPIIPGETNGSCVKPFLLTDPSTPDLPHSYLAEQTVVDGGKMDGFISSAGGCDYAMGYYNNATIPYLWDYAHHFVLADHTFQSFIGYSIPNHWAMIAALAPLIGFKSAIKNTSSYGMKLNYTEEADSIPTLTTLMSNANLSWKYYDTPITAGDFQDALENGNVTSYWNPYKAVESSYNSSMSDHFVIRGQILYDINTGNLPNISYVIPSAPISDHAPANVTWGMWWIARIINYLGESKYWNNTVVIVTWDDYGGWYDGVQPPYVNNYTNITGTYAEGAGLRVPMLIISPYSKPGYVDHTFYTFSSIMKYIEQNFNLTGLNVRDKSANSIIDALNYSQTPLPPVIEPLNDTQTDVTDTWAFSPAGPLPNVYNLTGPCLALELSTIRNNTESSSNLTYVQYIKDDPD